MFYVFFLAENNETDILKFQTSISIIFCVTYDNIILTVCLSFFSLRRKIKESKKAKQKQTNPKNPQIKFNKAKAH